MYFVTLTKDLDQFPVSLRFELRELQKFDDLDFGFHNVEDIRFQFDVAKIIIFEWTVQINQSKYVSLRK